MFWWCNIVKRDGDIISVGHLFEFFGGKVVCWKEAEYGEVVQKLESDSNIGNFKIIFTEIESKIGTKKSY